MIHGLKANSCWVDIVLLMKLSQNVVGKTLELDKFWVQLGFYGSNLVQRVPKPFYGQSKTCEMIILPLQEKIILLPFKCNVGVLHSLNLTLKTNDEQKLVYGDSFFICFFFHYG